MLLPHQIALLQSSFSNVLTIRDAAADLFYSRLFETDPSTRAMFAKSDMRVQGRKLIAALSLVINGLDRPQRMLAPLRELATRHVGYGVRDRHYETVGEALIWTLEQGLGPAFTPETRAAWVAAYALVSGIMREAAGDARLERLAS